MPKTPKLDLILDPAGEAPSDPERSGEQPQVDSDARGVRQHPATRRAEDGPPDDDVSRPDGDDEHGHLTI